jgi:hypothetical protein
MRSSKCSLIVSGIAGSAPEEEVHREIENFLQAMASYPDHFETNPSLSFQQYLCNLSGSPDAR